MLLLATLPSSWQPFITTQAFVVGLTIEKLIARILPEDTMHSNTSSALTIDPPSVSKTKDLSADPEVSRETLPIRLP